MWQPDDMPEETAYSWYVPNPRGRKPNKQLPRTGKLSRAEKKERKAFFNAKRLLKIRRRRRKFKLRNGYLLEVSWHYGRRCFVAEFHAPNGRWDAKYSTSPKELFAQVRYGIACLETPEIQDVRKRLGLSKNNAKVYTRRTDELLEVETKT